MQPFVKKIMCLLLISLIAACATTETNTTPVTSQNNWQTKSLCKYTSRKGVAELVSIQDFHYHFVFFPGNLTFSVDQKELDIAPIKGGEYKALIEELVQGGDECPKHTPQLISLPH